MPVFSASATTQPRVHRVAGPALGMGDPWHDDDRQRSEGDADRRGVRACVSEEVPDALERHATGEHEEGDGHNAQRPPLLGLADLPATYLGPESDEHDGGGRDLGRSKIPSDYLHLC